MAFTDEPLSPEREAYIREFADASTSTQGQHIGELLWEIERLRAGQQRLLEKMREGQTWDDRWLSSEALLTQEEIRECFGWKPEPPAGARPFCTCKHTLKRHPDGGRCEYCRYTGSPCAGFTPKKD